MNETAERLARHLFDVPVFQNQYRSAFVEALIVPDLETSGWSFTGDGWKGWDIEHLNATLWRNELRRLIRSPHRTNGRPSILHGNARR
jgi:hypothetical protein